MPRRRSLPYVPPKPSKGPPRLPGTIASIVGPDTDAAMIERMLGQVYRDFASEPFADDASLVCMHLHDQLTGQFDRDAMWKAMGSPWMPGAHGRPWDQKPSEQGARDLARRYGVIG